MAEHGDRTGSANTLEKSISRKRIGEIGELLFTCRRRINPRTRRSATCTVLRIDRDAIKRPSSANLEDSILKFGNWRRTIV